MPKILPYAWILLLAGSVPISNPVCARAQDEPSVEAAESAKASEEVTANPEPISPEHHRWARFPVGAWRKVRIIEQTLDQQITNQSEIILTEYLRDVSSQQYTLEQHVEIEVGGDRVESSPATVKLALATDEPGTIQSVSEVSPESFPLDGRDVDARVLIVRTGGEAHSVRTQLWYSPEEPPYLLRSISEAVVPASEETVWRRTRKVLARELPFEVEEKHVNATFWEEEHVSTKGTRHSILVSIEDIPGGVVTRWTKETNAQRRLIRREIEAILDWGIGTREAD